MKAKNGSTNIAVRTYLKMRLKLHRCYKVACEWYLKPFLNLKDARRSVISELCKPLASTTLFASACLSKKQKENSKGTKKRENPTCTQQMDGSLEISLIKQEERIQLRSNFISTPKFWIVQSPTQKLPGQS